MKIANKQIKGKQIEANNGFEDGHWLYDVIIVKDHQLTEIAMNTLTGKQTHRRPSLLRTKPLRRRQRKGR